MASRLFPTYLASRSAAKSACRQGRVLVDGLPAESSRLVGSATHVTLCAADSPEWAPFELALQIVYEDEAMAVVVKPAGYPVSGNRLRTIGNALPFNLRPSSAADALVRPLPVHRLDAPTSGLLLVGKTGAAVAALGRAFQQRRITKRYRALVVGALPESTDVEVPLDGKSALTRVGVVARHRSVRTGWVTLVDAWPVTGRTHQIRRHLAALGHPVLGDGLYGRAESTLRGSGLYLCAVGLTLPHPESGRLLRIRHAQPAKFAAFIRREARRWRRLRSREAISWA